METLYPANEFKITMEIIILEDQRDINIHEINGIQFVIMKPNQINGEVASRSVTGSMRSTRRWASLRQHVSSNDGGKPRVELLLDPPGSKSSTPSSQPHTPNTPRTPHTPLRKSNWEMTRGSEIGVGLTAGKDITQETNANASITQPPRKCALCRFLKSLCASHRFKNLQKSLARRQEMKLEETDSTVPEKQFLENTNGITGGDAVPTLLPADEPKQYDARSRLTGGAGSCPRCASSLETDIRGQPTISSYFGETGEFVFSALVAAISRPGMNEIWLAGVSGIVLVTLLALQVALNIHLAFESREYQSGGPLAAAWAVCFFIYMAYALLPIRLRHACIAGIIFSLAHLIGAFVLYPSQYPAMMEHKAKEEEEEKRKIGVENPSNWRMHPVLSRGINIEQRVFIFELNSVLQMLKNNCNNTKDNCWRTREHGIPPICVKINKRRDNEIRMFRTSTAESSPLRCKSHDATKLEYSATKKNLRLKILKFPLSNEKPKLYKK
ncbi:hypothetical protein WN51_14447 [Melipona quadrifasciata]|uniref:Uncharacterized protein n=1 Tax=Melipona quadrifasciata TaxID=166423 RepID=A0A0N0U4T6_9HYME|nr:hypothetical protein WN51_14447 [Melipona quadrifasciata]